MADGKTVLVVDDNPDAIEFANAVISEIGDINVITAENGDAGIEKAKAESPDLIVLDVMMPGKSGFDVFAELREDEGTKDIPIIMLTGVSEETGMKFSADDMGEFIGKRPEAFLDKPVDPAQLEETVKKTLGI